MVESPNSFSCPSFCSLLVLCSYSNSVGLGMLGSGARTWSARLPKDLTIEINGKTPVDFTGSWIQSQASLWVDVNAITLGISFQPTPPLILERCGQRSPSQP